MVDFQSLTTQFLNCIDVASTDEQLTLKSFIDNWHLLASDDSLILAFLGTTSINTIFKQDHNTQLYSLISDIITDESENKDWPLFQRFILELIYNLTILFPINKPRLYTPELIQLFIDLDIPPNHELRPLSRNLLFALLQMGLSNEQLSSLYYKSFKDSELRSLFTSAFLEYPNATPLIYLTNHQSSLRFNNLILDDIKKGFTIQTWIQVDYKNNEGANDTEDDGSRVGNSLRNPMLAVYNDTGSYILQYSLDDHKLCVESRNSVSKYFESQSFESFSFESGKLYNVALVHRCDNHKSSRIDLFVNGNYIQSCKTSYLFEYLKENGTSSSSKSFAKFNFTSPLSSVTRSAAIKVELSGSSVVDNLLFGISGLTLINKAMDLKWIMLSWYLGPNYNGGFQDTHIENLLTERNKTEMKLRLQEYFETGSDLLASDFEDLRLFPSTSNSSTNASSQLNTSKNQTTSTSNKSTRNELSLDHKLAHLRLQKKDIVLSASVQFTSVSRDSICFLDPTGTRNKVVLAEVPKRDVAIMNSRPLLDTLYAIGGFGIPLRYADTAKDSESLVSALNLLFHLLKNDVRSLQEFESQSGYDILATLLKTKKTLINLSVLDCILDFVGYDHSSPASSVLKNPLAYRSLITDFDVWKPSDSDIFPQSLNNNSKDTFKFLVFQFTVFGQDSNAEIPVI
ncbi:unnamed protein product [Ambrosiozyma monospora]|uniref:Unnamed protein product n=1 Tax=Ambrosiozyma monospora TaxID=43982 RepID=A0ACB5T4L2_AMBMO|nr:unnamed protein product [Ambrosiozyma monospora]